MCGVVGYVGNRDSVSVLLGGLAKLEYRGYDSAGLAVGNGRGLEIRRAAGKLANLRAEVDQWPLSGTYGIGHTRWATHGSPSKVNAHPHCDEQREVAVVHNGIIENYLALRKEMELEGVVFASETDSEVAAHLVARYQRSGASLEEAVEEAVGRLQGPLALAAISFRDPKKLVAARRGAPAAVGLGEEEYILASDVSPIVDYTKKLLYLQDGDLCVITMDGPEIRNGGTRSIRRRIENVTWSAQDAQKQGYRHFMLKEIFEQPTAVRNTLRDRIDAETGSVRLEGAKDVDSHMSAVRHVRLLACGSSWHAALVGKAVIEKLAQVPVEVDYASEFRYREPFLPQGSLVVTVSQSGETADTLGAQREACRLGSPTLAICNVEGSTIPREADGVLYTRAGPEIGVAATKTFVAQLAALQLVALRLRQAQSGGGDEMARRYAQALLRIPQDTEEVLQTHRQCEGAVQGLRDIVGSLFLGRGVHFPVALEGALKLKEISYVFAQGYPAGEMKHGPNALIDERLPVFVAGGHDPEDPASLRRHDKVLSNIMEVRARGASVIATATRGDHNMADSADHVVPVPKTLELLSPLLEIIPFQFMAYYLAVLKGCDVDQPRNLAKSVTVE